MNQPNILLIMCDTVRCDALGCMGGISTVTPNLDKLAKQGVLFNQAHSVAPVCCPARTSLLTGTYPQVHMTFENGINRVADLPAFTDYLKQAGYTNIMVGKTHFGQVPSSFDVQYVLNGEKAAENNDFYGQYAHANGYKRASEAPFDKPEEYCLDAYLAETTINEIEKVKNSDKPFFTFCSFPSPHGPIDPLEKYVQMFKDCSLPPVNYKDKEEEKLPLRLRNLLGLSQDDTTDFDYGTATSLFDEAKGSVYSKEMVDEIDHFRRRYYALMNYCDRQIGKIIDYLDRENLRENTLVIFTSDHGQQYYDHGFNDKHTFYDSSFRVPLIMSMPKTIPQNEQREFATTIDVTATILGAAGLSSDEVSGFDLFTPLKNGEQNPRTIAAGVLLGYTALVTERFKIEYYFDSAEGRLFDRKNDQLEKNDLYKDKGYNEIKTMLLQGLLTWYCSITNLNHLKMHTTSGGPVAKRAAKIINQKKAVDPDSQLQCFVLQKNL